jgi:hypothetical protein
LARRVFHGQHRIRSACHNNCAAGESKAVNKPVNKAARPRRSAQRGSARFKARTGKLAEMAFSPATGNWIAATASDPAASTAGWWRNFGGNCLVALIGSEYDMAGCFILKFPPNLRLRLQVATTNGLPGQTGFRAVAA